MRSRPRRPDGLPVSPSRLLDLTRSGAQFARSPRTPLNCAVAAVGFRPLVAPGVLPEPLGMQLAQNSGLQSALGERGSGAEKEWFSQSQQCELTPPIALR